MEGVRGKFREKRLQRPRVSRTLGPKGTFTDIVHTFLSFLLVLYFLPTCAPPGSPPAPVSRTMSPRPEGTADGDSRGGLLEGRGPVPNE